jgi:hypothetical protein
MGFLATAHEEKFAEINLTGDLGERFGGDELGADLRQHSFIGIAVALKEHFGEKELEHRISKEFEALIVRLSALALVAQTGMSERLAKQRAISERVAEDGFEEFHEARLEAKARVFGKRLMRSIPAS